MVRGAEQRTAALTQVHRMMLCIPEPSKKTTENDITYWAGQGQHFQYYKNPVRACLHHLLPVFSQADG